MSRFATVSPATASAALSASFSLRTFAEIVLMVCIDSMRVIMGAMDIAQMNCDVGDKDTNLQQEALPTSVDTCRPAHSA